MTAFRSERARGEEPPALHVHAMDDLRFIRQTMEEAGSFTAVPGWGMTAIGVTALVATVVAARERQPERWLVVWLGEAALALVISAWSMVRKSRAKKMPLLSAPARRFALSFAPPLLAGAALTAALWPDHRAAIPGVWLLLYGTAVATGGAFSIRIIPVMGLCLMAVGLAALLGPPLLASPALAIGFGVVHLAFGVVIARRHGG